MLNEAEQQQILTEATQVNPSAAPAAPPPDDAPPPPPPPPALPRQPHFLMPNQAAPLREAGANIEMARMQLNLAQSEYRRLELETALAVNLDTRIYDSRVQVLDQQSGTLGFMPKGQPPLLPGS